MSRILITGANGYLGMRICRYLSEIGHEIVALCYPDIPDDNEWKSALSAVYVGNIADRQIIDELSNENVEILIHLVSLDQYQSKADPAIVASVNITPVWSLLDLFTKRNLKHFIYFSTVHVYGDLANRGVLTEDTICTPLSPYALTHYIGENICEYYNRISSTKCTVLRLSNSYGAPLKKDANCWSLVINDFCKQAYMNREFTIASDGSSYRDFIHGNDVCNAVNTLISQTEKCTDFIYHVSSGISYSIATLASIVQREFYKRYRREVSVKYLQEPIKDKYSEKNFIVDNSRLKKLGFSVSVSIEDGINSMFDYFDAINNGK